MRTRTLLAASIALMLATNAEAATDAHAVLSANKAATGTRSDDRMVLQTESQLSGPGYDGFDLSTVDLKDGRSVSNDTLGAATESHGYDGSHAWLRDDDGTVTVKGDGEAMPLAINNAYRNANLWWRPDFGGASIVLDPARIEGGASFDVVTVTPKNGEPFDAWFDATTHLLARIIEKRGSRTVTVAMSDYRRLDGVQIPYTVVVDTGNGADKLQTATLLTADFAATQPDSVYAPPKPAVTAFTMPPKIYWTPVPFKLYNNHIYANVAINEHGPLQFLLDTSGHNRITSATAAQLGLKITTAKPGTGTGEEATTAADALQMADATINHPAFGVVSEVMPPNIEGTDVQGTIGFEVFKHFVTKIDYGRKRIILLDPAAFMKVELGTPVKFVLDDGVPEVEGTFEGIPAKFRIDPGSSSEVELTGAFAEANGLRGKHPKGVEAVDSWDFGGPERDYITRASQVTLGSLSVPDVVTALPLQQKAVSANASVQGTIGSGFLKRYIVTFDYIGNVMYLRPIQGQVDVSDYDRAGMWINPVKEGVEVMDVTANGPAQAAGIKVGDIITAVDGHPMSDVVVPIMRRNLREMPEGTVITFKIRQGAATRDLKVTLRNQI